MQISGSRSGGFAFEAPFLMTAATILLQLRLVLMAHNATKTEFFNLSAFSISNPRFSLD
jgi:hypothetical protein